MMRQVKTNFVATLAIFGLFATSLAGAQQVISPTTLQPINIGVSGSYVLGGNIVASAAVATGNVIEIIGDDITLDLGGYSITSSNTCGKIGHPAGNTCNGTIATSQILLKITGSRVTVKNGHLKGSTGYGIAIQSPYAHLESLTVSNNKASGIVANSSLGSSAVMSGTTLTNVTSVLNGYAGFDGPYGSAGDALVKNSIFSDNYNGLAVYDGVIDGVIASHNVGVGILGNHAVITNATVAGNGNYGVSDGSIVKNVAATSNGTGFKTSGDGTIYVNDSAMFNSSYNFSLTSFACYSNIFISGSGPTYLSGGVALTGTHVTCP